MKWLFLIILLTFKSLAWAAPDQFDYEAVASKIGLNVVSIGKPFTYPGVNRFYTDQMFRRAIMVVENVEGVRQKMVVNEFSKYTMIEFPTSANTFTSVALVNIPRVQWETDLVPQETKTTNMQRFMDFFISKAHADDTCDIAGAENMMGSLDGLGAYYSNGFMKLASSCMMGVLEGVWESTGGMLTSAWKGLKSLASNPKKFWDEKVEEFNKLKSFLLDFEVSMKNLVSGFNNLPDDVKAQMLCSFIGSIGTDILISVLTAGAGTGKLALSLKNYTSKILKIEKLMTKLNKLGKLKEIPSAFFDKISKGLVSEKRLNSIQTLTHHQFDDLAVQLVKCSL